MKLLPTAVILCSFSGIAFGAVFYSCGFVNNVDCSQFKNNLTCGTNLVTYRNKCEFSKAHCADTTIDLKHYGACNATDGSTSTSGAEEVLDFFCTHLSHMDCATGGTKVCGSDGRMYDNYCEYEKAKCTHRNLKVVDCLVD